MARYAVIGCACGARWAVELRHATTTCPRCARKADLARRRRFWEGDDAQEAAAVMRAATPREAVTRPLPRHDDPLDAAAAQGRAQRNMSRRAEAVATWLCRLEGEAVHDRLMDALARSGIPAERAEQERIRLLVQDHIYEPRPGVYACL